MRNQFPWFLATAGLILFIAWLASSIPAFLWLSFGCDLVALGLFIFAKQS